MSDKFYVVSVPIVAKTTIGVTAKSEKEAIEKAIKCDWDLRISIPENSEADYAEIEEADAYEKVVEGNLYYPPINETVIEAVEDIDDED